MTGLEQAMQITPSSGLSPEEIDRLIMEAETSADTDVKEKELILQKNKLESLINNARRAMSEFGKSLAPDQQHEINAALNKAENYIESENLDEIKMALTDVETQTGKITEALMATV
jgi:molecular chaperone DnaK